MKEYAEQEGHTKGFMYSKRSVLLTTLGSQPMVFVRTELYPLNMILYSCDLVKVKKITQHTRKP